MTLYQDKYRVETTRLRQWDYSLGAWYFITICTRNREPFLGDVRDGRMRLSAIGGIANESWRNIPNHFANVQIDEFIVMPNHVHGIIIIDDNCDPVETRERAFLHTNKFGPLTPRSLQAVVHAFKSAVTRQCGRNSLVDFAWQPRFYDHVIRKDESLDRIREYIVGNPAKWDSDKDNPSSIFM